VISIAEAGRMQNLASRQHEEIYRRYVEQEEILALLRRNLLMAVIYVRDFGIRTTPEQASLLQGQLRDLEAEDNAALDRLARLSPNNSQLPAVRKRMREFWQVMKMVPDTMLLASRQQFFDFLQQEMVQPRAQLYSALRGLTSADQQQLQGNEQAFSELRREAAERLFLLLGLGVLMGVAVAFVSVRHSEGLERRAERHYQEVEETKRELQRLSASLLEIEEEGRRRLSRELHDEIGQSLALLQIQITNALAGATGLSPELRDQLQRARILAERTVETVRDISLLLRPPLLDDLGLVPALQFQVEDFLRRGGVACEFVDENVPDHLPDAVKTCVYRAVQEALHNCEKHSGASRVSVAVRQKPSVLELEVEDNGCGFALNDKSMPRQPKGLGLLGMRERATLAGGSLAIQSAPGRGTRILLRFPLSAPSPTMRPKEVTV
jgi:signal transduction histidine kinase